VQRELAKEVKGESTKGMSRIQREGFYEERAELLPGELSRTTQDWLRGQISEIMKSQKGPLKIKRR
jgi:hypothetical protein